MNDLRYTRKDVVIIMIWAFVWGVLFGLLVALWIRSVGLPKDTQMDTVRYAVTTLR